MGFTLAELLIALAILGVIATFAIPKVLTAQNSSKDKAMAKEVAGMLSGALQAYKMDHTLSAATSANDLVPYLNYVKLLTSGSVDDTTATYDCSDGGTLCIKLHNGGVLANNFGPISFDGTGPLNAIYLSFDPDGQVSTTKAVNFFLYANGQVRTEGTIEPNTVSSDFVRSPDPALDPPWFGWN